MENLDKILSEVVRKTVKETLETIMNTERDIFIEKNDGTKNGTYRRTLNTKYGFIDDLRVPRDREGNFKTMVFEPYRRSLDIEDLILALYSNGISTRRISMILDEIFHGRYSKSTISKITDVVKEEIDEWQSRKLKERYFAIYIDALFLNLRRNTVEKEALHIALGIDVEGKKEILGFWINPSESSNSWELIINDLKERGIKEVLLFIADGLSGIQETIKKYYPRADFQSCIIHAERNLLSKVRAGDKDIIGREMKKIFDASSEEEARKRFNEFKETWNNRYPKAIYNMETRLDLLLTYYKYPEPIRKVIRSTNMIERLNKEIRRRIKIIDSLPGEESARKIIYLRIIE